MDDKYEKPSGGIPASDIASGVIPDVTGKADKVQNATSGNFASLDANGNFADSGHKHSDYLTEHQDLTDYVKNTDYADEDNAGIVKSSSYYGTRMLPNGAIGTYRALTTGIKAGSDDYRPIVPYVQDVSTFYGLAKAAGDTSQSTSSNAVGTYTDNAKAVIQKMLGISELIAPYESGTASKAYSVGECFMLNGKLCRVTSAINASDEIVIGTNCVQTTIMEEIAR